MTGVRNIWSALDAIDEHWSPRVVADANGQSVKVAKLLGELVWHHHAEEDEIFLVLRGSLSIRYRDRPDITLREGDIHTVPRGVEHNPRAEEECWIVLFEPAETAHTGNVVHERTRSITEQRSQIDA
jgi:mannose-6-phosphate isomerase-like protein (cupin superfamily)